MTETDPATFEQLTPTEGGQPTLIEGLPGHGLVASIAADQIIKQLVLDHHGSIYDESFSQVVTFPDGMVRDPVRVYSGDDPPVITLQSDLAMPPQTFGPLAKCMLSDLADDFERAIFLPGAPAPSDEARGTVTGVATQPEVRADLKETGIDLAREPGVFGGVTGHWCRRVITRGPRRGSHCRGPPVPSRPRCGTGRDRYRPRASGVLRHRHHGTRETGL